MTKTYCEIPYFVTSPEICKGELYDQKSDIWALGCLIYELAALKKPFKAPNLFMYVKIVCEKNPEPLPDHVDPNIQTLVDLLLHKDKENRPSIWEIAGTKIIYERIVKFATANNCQDIIESLDLKKFRKDLAQLSYDKLGRFDINNLDELAEKIRESIELKTIKFGFFSKEHNIVTSEDLANWFKENLNITSKEEVNKRLNKLVKSGFLLALPNVIEDDSKVVYYRFPIDEPGTAVNRTRIVQDQTRTPLKLTTDLIQKLNVLIKESRVGSSSNTELKIDIEKLKCSEAYKDFKKWICELQAIQLSSLDKLEKLACFLNIYQVMHLHKLIKEKSEPIQAKPDGIFNQVKDLIRYNTISFCYNISQMMFTLDDIMHGVLRGNKNVPGSYLKLFSTKDPRSKILEENDLRVLFVFFSPENIPHELQAFTPMNLEKELDRICKEYLSINVTYDSDQKQLILPNLFKTYKDDFENQDDMINFLKILKFSMFCVSPNKIKNLLKDGKASISYIND